MSSKDKNLSEFSGKLPTLPNAKIGIVVSEWNEAVTGALLSGALKVLVRGGNTGFYTSRTVHVPGSFELILGSQKLAQIEDIDAVISIGCVIQGETRHFDFICQAVATGISDVNLKFDKPVIFGVLNHRQPTTSPRSRWWESTATKGKKLRIRL